MTDNPSKRIADRIASCGDEFAQLDRIREATGKSKVYELDVAACQQAYDLIRKLDTEVFRLRQTIGCYVQGRGEIADLRRVWTTWNDGSRA
jgi:hypothetical protein